ncbi:hypothetical protein TorRG33x02_008360, partial [Trema orientale]
MEEIRKLRDLGVYSHSTGPLELRLLVSGGLNEEREEKDQESRISVSAVMLEPMHCGNRLLESWNILGRKL